MRIPELLDRDRPVFSFEFFPPKDDPATALLFERLTELRELRPGFVSVTYGAGGSTRERTIDIVSRIEREFGVTAMAHLTCVGHSRADLERIASTYRDRGVRNVLALRGDPPVGEVHFRAVPGGFAHASELVRLLRERFDFAIGAACYPEGHPETPDLADDLTHLKVKVDAGVDFLITQLFFDNAAFFAFRDRVRAAGIGIPIVPGIMPITNVDQVKRFTTMCGATIPADLLARLEAVADDPAEVFRVGCDHAVRQCAELLAAEAPGIHFYTLNRSSATREIHRRLSGQD